MSIVCLLRHGESTANVNPEYCKNHEQYTTLTELGKEQAKQVAKDIKYITQKYTVGQPTVLTSPYNRTIETTKIIHDTYREEPLLCEWYTGTAKPYPGLTDFIDKHDKERRMYDVISPLEYRPPRGESELDVYMRMGMLTEKFNWFQTDGFFSFFIIVTHGICCEMLHYYLTGEHENKSGCWPNCEMKIYNIMGRMNIDELQCKNKPKLKGDNDIL